MPPRRSKLLVTFSALVISLSFSGSVFAAPPTPTPSPTAALPSPTPSPTAVPFSRYWVQNHSAATLWDGPTSKATSLLAVEPWHYFQVTGPQVGDRLPAQDPRDSRSGWLEARLVGPVGQPFDPRVAAPPQAAPVAAQPVVLDPLLWQGLTHEDTLVYDTPGGTLVDVLADGTPVNVSDWVRGPMLTDDNQTWAELGTGGYVHSSFLSHAPLSTEVMVTPSDIPSDGHWADANLTFETITFYDGATPVRVALMNSGRPGGWATESHAGVFPVSSRVPNATMRGPGYSVSGVLFTQYFTGDMEAIHLNWWLTDDERGIPRSHGCIGLAYDDAAFAWDFLRGGSLVSVHS